MLLTTVAGFPHALQIETKYLWIHKTNRQSDTYGPDLAFIKLPPGKFLNEIQGRLSFLNVTLDSENQLIRAMDQNSFMAFVGFPAVEQAKGEPQLGFAQVDVLNGFAFFTGQENQERRDGFDYLEVGVSRTPVNVAPKSFGGVSGGGLWRLPIRRRKDDPPGTEYIDGYHFAGVIFFQSPIINEHQFLRAHGPESLYRRFIPEVLEALK